MVPQAVPICAFDTQEHSEKKAVPFAMSQRGAFSPSILRPFKH